MTKGRKGPLLRDRCSPQGEAEAPSWGCRKQKQNYDRSQPSRKMLLFQLNEGILPLLDFLGFTIQGV